MDEHPHGACWRPVVIIGKGKDLLIHRSILTWQKLGMQTILFRLWFINLHL